MGFSRKLRCVARIIAYVDFLTSGLMLVLLIALFMGTADQMINYEIIESGGNQTGGHDSMPVLKMDEKPPIKISDLNLFKIFGNDWLTPNTAWVFLLLGVTHMMCQFIQLYASMNLAKSTDTDGNPKKAIPRAVIWRNIHSVILALYVIYFVAILAWQGALLTIFCRGFGLLFVSLYIRELRDGDNSSTSYAVTMDGDYNEQEMAML